MNYTKGEWETKEGLDGIWHINADHKTIVQVWDFPEAEDNANLIAAAPRMHVAGTNALVSLKLWATEHPDDEVLAMVITQLEYALAKAGERCIP